ncbi:hypothetical protein G7Y89_g11361 [Cudoniella acicularis]|uniref:RNB domain-containing protein n=1 Tax=Cudoniella acicularis TaxID=354080 RepID=A0A8H4RB07_9HELO|nr:hypothetical protein G7Y89_g11361 [Cudoniella acicularis]
MLRALHPRKRVTPSFVCWKCLAKLHQGSAKTRQWQGPIDRRSTQSNERQNSRFSKRLLNSSSSHRATEVSSAFGEKPPPFEPTPLELNIRERLHQWEINNVEASPAQTLADEYVSNIIDSGPLLSNNDEVSDDANRDEWEYSPQDTAELVDMGGLRTFLVPGDLVELMNVGSRKQELAIFVREIAPQGQFYTMSGRWCARKLEQPLFYAPNFVRPEELSDIIPFLPDTVVPQDMEDKLYEFSRSVPRNIGKELFLKMSKFWEQADEVYLSASHRLEYAHRYIAHPFKLTFATLNEIAEKLLGTRFPKDDSGQYPIHVLYAVHRSLVADCGIRSRKKGTLRAGGQYKILSLNEINEVNRVTECVRLYVDSQAKGLSKQFWGPLYTFVKKARHLIDQSRENRQFTPYGSIGPSKKRAEISTDYLNGTPESAFNPTESMFLRFMESFTCLHSFTVSSSYVGIGATILRAIDRYEGVDLNLQTAWTFMKEVGAVPPWETRFKYDLQLPYLGQRLQCEVGGAIEGYTEDKLARIRKDWGQLPVFCIDDASASEIDDGISVEPADSPDEYWVHIHVADPASHLVPDSPASNYAFQRMQNSYLPDRVTTMLDREFVRSKLSLAPDRPCLTFSAKLSADGNLLDGTITPGVVRNVVFLTPGTAFEASSGKKVVDDAVVYCVGSKIEQQSESLRPLTAIDQLSDEQREALRTIYKIGQVRKKLVMGLGGMTSDPLNFNLQTSFDGLVLKSPTTSHSTRHYGDPAIKITIPRKTEGEGRLDAVQQIMLLAGQVCAKWCSERGLPIIYRVTQRNTSKEHPLDYYKRCVLPNMDSEGDAPFAVKNQYLNFVGSAQPSTTPGPHVLAGANILTKITSPLRRFPDLLNHWQIGAALLKENRTGRSLIGNTSESFLPYTKAQIDVLLPRIDSMEREIRRVEMDAKRVWLAQFLLRAWVFGEAKIPSPLTFCVRSVNHIKKTAGGKIVEFLGGATMDISGLPNQGDLKGDEFFEVELTSLDAYRGRIDVKPLRRIEDPEVIRELNKRAGF